MTKLLDLLTPGWSVFIDHLYNMMDAAPKIETIAEAITEQDSKHFLVRRFLAYINFT